MTNILEEVSKTSVKLILKEPFYGHFFSGLVKEVTEATPTAAVGANRQNKTIKLMVNEGFWKSLTNPEHRYGLIKHEVLHIVLKHLTMMPEYSNPRLFNIAADMVVNQYIEKRQLPEGGITLESFWFLEKRFGLTLEPEMSVKYYYRILKKFLESNPSPVQLSEEDKNEMEEKGLPIPIVPEDLTNEEGKMVGSHRFWKEIEEMTEAERRIMDRYINEAIQRTAQRVGPRGIGNLPAGLKVYLDTLLESLKPNLDWRRALRIFAASSTRTYIKNTIRRPSKRFGTTPGIKVKRKQKLLIAVDTSGSVSNDELRKFFAEVYHIWRQGAEILVVECDTHIHNTYSYSGKAPEYISGRGGTDFNEPIRFANESYRPDALVYFTDGLANIPSTVSRCPVLWMITTNGIDSNNDIWSGLQGRKVRMA
ncbi:hypothetical protein FUAX_50370 (plasmid) [Fulvitalea axinellae]|uniref:Metallopeptidase domain-containing protein n=1 Tax=Fulvitalea axinellae TaxID=1182444 RepID=A0AAU9CTS9_9BACT|nr:hypothetical protein FUAX_50370 [Fulvitalea axinellae]